MDIGITVTTIDLNGYETHYEETDNLYDLYLSEKYTDIPDSDAYYYYRYPGNELFACMDSLEKTIPNIGHTVCWKWFGVRKGVEYYLQLDVSVLAEVETTFWDALKAIFVNGFEEIEEFELPDVDVPFDFEQDNEDDQINDEEILRDIEELTLGDPSIQWRREPMEYNGGGDVITTIGVAAGLASFAYTFEKDFVQYMMNNHYARRIRKLRNKVMKECNNEGHLIEPKPEAPSIFNAKTGEAEYEFIQILDDGSKNRVFIGIDSGKTRKVPYR